MTRHSEFVHMKEFDCHIAGSPEKSFKPFLNRYELEPFQKKLSYTEDAYERKEDMRRLDY